MTEERNIKELDALSHAPSRGISERRGQPFPKVTDNTPRRKSSKSRAVDPYFLGRGKYVKHCRIEFGYNRKRFGRMLGYEGGDIKRTMYRVETGRRNIPDAKMYKIIEWVKFGLPKDAPERNLDRSTSAFWEYREKLKPRVLNLTNN